MARSGRLCLLFCSLFVLLMVLPHALGACSDPCDPSRPQDHCQKGSWGSICCWESIFICPAIVSWNPITLGASRCCESGGMTCTSSPFRSCGANPTFFPLIACSGCPVVRGCDGNNGFSCCDLGYDCNSDGFIAVCERVGGAAAAATVTTGPPPPPPEFGTYGGYTAVGRPITYPAGQAGAWGSGAHGGLYPLPPGAYPNPEAPQGSGPGAGHAVPRHGGTTAGAAQAILQLSAVPQPIAILAGAPGSITFFAVGESPSYIRRVDFIIHGNTVGSASGAGQVWSAMVNIGALNLRANTLLRAVAYGEKGTKLSFATMMIPVFVPPAWVAAVFGTPSGTATDYSTSYSISPSLGDGEEPDGVDADELEFDITLEGGCELEFELSSSQGTVVMTGSGDYTLTIITPKGDSSGSISGHLTSNIDIAAVEGGYYSVKLNNLEIGVQGDITIAIPQLSWKFSFWRIAEIHIQVSILFGLGISVLIPASPDHHLFGIPIWLQSVALSGYIGVSLNVGGEVAGIGSAECDVSAKFADTITWTLPSSISIPPPSFTLELKCKGCIDLLFGDLCKEITIFSITCEFGKGCHRDRKRRSIMPSDVTLLPLMQSLEFYSAKSDSLLLTGLRPVPSIAVVSIPGLVSMVLWRGVVNGTAQVQYASCYQDVAGGCWYDGVYKAPLLSGLSANQHTAARFGNTNASLLVAVSMSPILDFEDELSWTSRLVGATYDASEGVWSEWTELAPLWPEIPISQLHLDIKPRLSEDGSVLVFARLFGDGSFSVASSVSTGTIGQWTEPVTVVHSADSINVFRVARAPTGEAIVLYNSNDTAFTICTSDVTVTSWICLGDEPRVAMAVSVRWSPMLSVFVLAYADVQLNIVVELLHTSGAPSAAAQRMLVGYVPSVLDIAVTPFGAAIGWDCQEPGRIIYALVASDGVLRRSMALNVNVSDALGGEPVVLSLSWTGNSLLAAGLSTGGPDVFEGAGYLFARTLPSDADAALGKVQFTPDFSLTAVTATVLVANLGLMPWSGAGVSVSFSLVSSSGATTALGSVSAPASLASGELANVTFVWRVATGAAGVLRISLTQNVDVNVTNDVIIVLPCAVAFDTDTFAIVTPSDRSYFATSVSSSGPAAAAVTVQIWSAQGDEHPSDAVLVNSAVLALKPSLKATLRVPLTAAQLDKIGTFVRIDVVYDGAVVSSTSGLLPSSGYDFVVDLAGLTMLSIDHTHLRIGLPVTNRGVRTAKHVPVTASVLHDDDTTTVLTTVFIATLPPGGNVSALLSFTTPTSGTIQIQFEANPMINGKRLLSEVWTHNNMADRTFVTRAPSDGASWSSSIAGHGAIASFASATSPQSLGTSSGNFRPPAVKPPAVWGNNAASSGSTGSASSSSAYSSSASSQSSASLASSSSSSSAYASASGSYLQPASSQGFSSSSSSFSYASGVSSSAPTEILAVFASQHVRIVLAGNPNPAPYAALVAQDSAISRVDFLFHGAVIATSQSRSVLFIGNLPGGQDASGQLVACAYSSASGETPIATMSVPIPVLTLPPWFMSLDPEVTYGARGEWIVVAKWQTMLKGGVMVSLKGSSLLDAAVIFGDTGLDMAITVRASGFASLHGNGSMPVQIRQPSGALTTLALLSVSVGGNISLDDSHGFGDDVDLNLHSATITFTGIASFELPELLTQVRVATASLSVLAPLHVSLTIAPVGANFTLYKIADIGASLLDGLPIAVTAQTTAVDLGISVAVTAAGLSDGQLMVADNCVNTSSIPISVSWTPAMGLTFGPASTVLALSCALCMEEAGAGRMCTSSAPLLSWSLLRPAPVLPAAVWLPAVLQTALTEETVLPAIATRFRYQVRTQLPSFGVRLIQAEGAELLVWSDVPAMSSDASAPSSLYFVYRARALSWPNDAPKVIPASEGLVQPALGALQHGCFLLVAVSSTGLVQASYNSTASEWSSFTDALSFSFGPVDSAPELTHDASLLIFTRRTEDYVQLLSVDRNTDQISMKWRVPKVVIFDAAQMISYCFASSGKQATLLAFRTYTSSTISLCTFTGQMWHCSATFRPASSMALAFNGINFYLLYFESGNLIADRVAKDGSLLSSSNAPLLTSGSLAGIQAFDLTAVRSTTAGGHSVLAAWRIKPGTATFYVALLTSDGKLTVTKRHASLGLLSDISIAWTTSGLVAAAATQDTSGVLSVGVYVLPYTALLVVKSVDLSPPGSLTDSTNVTVTVQNIGAATFDVTTVGTLESEVRLSVHASDTYRDIGIISLQEPLASGESVSVSTVLSVSGVQLGALTASVGPSGDRALSAPLCTVSLTAPEVKAMGTGLWAHALLTALGNCNMRVQFSACAVESVAPSSPCEILGVVWTQLTPDFNQTVSVHLQDLWHLVGAAVVQLRVSTEDKGRSEAVNTIDVSTLLDIATTAYDFRIRAGGVTTSFAEESLVNNNWDGTMMTVYVPVQNLGCTFATEVSLEVAIQASVDGEWTGLASVSVSPGALGMTDTAEVTISLPQSSMFSASSSAVGWVLRFTVNGDSKYPESLWFDNSATRTVWLPILPTSPPKTIAPVLPYHVTTQKRLPLSIAALIGVSAGAAVFGIALGVAVYLVMRRRPAPQTQANRTPSPYVNMDS